MYIHTLGNDESERQRSEDDRGTTATMSASPAAARRRPCVLRVDGGCGQRATTTTTRPSSVDRLLADIAYQWQSERRRVAGRLGRRRRCDGQLRDVMTTSLTGTTAGGGVVYDQEDDDNCEAASAYWWTDVFLRYFVFDDDDDGAKSTVAADSDDLLFFVRRRRRRRRWDDNGYDERRLPSVQQRRRRIAYDTRAYRKQQHQRQRQQQPTLLPIGDPAVLWRHTVCLNAIVHRLRYTLTVAVCVHVPRRTTAAGTELCYGCDQDAADFGYDEEPDQEYDLQLLSRYVHTVYASTSGRRMDAAKGPRERPVYPAVCWAADDYAEAFRTVIVRPGQTVCAELVAAWPGPSTVVEEHGSGDEDSECGCDEDRGDRDDGRNSSCCRIRKAAVSVRQKQNRAVLFAAAVPYAAVRATYECKMSMYREAERQRRKRHKRGGGKKSSLGAALSASLTALFTGTKDSSGGARSPDGGDFDYYYAAPSSTDANRVEYVTVRGCIPGCDVGWSSDNEDVNFDSDSANSDVYNGTKGLAQMAVTLAPVQPSEPLTPSREYGAGRTSVHRAQQFCTAAGADGGAGVGDGGYEHEYCEYYGRDGGGDAGDECRQQRPRAVESPSPYAASEPGDFYDYGWDYETAASSGHQTPQTPTHHYQRQRQRRQLDRQRRRRHRRLSDPCSTSVYDLLYGQPECAAGGRRRRPQQHVGHGQHQPGGYGSGYRTSAAATPETPVLANRPHRAWSESEGLDRCGGGGGGGSGFTQLGKQQQKPVLLPPPPVPYYCAAEAAASGFTQFVHKSPGGWWARKKNRRPTGRGRRKRPHQRSGTTAAAATNRRRSASAGGNGRSSCCCTDDDDDDDDRSGGSDSDGDGGRSNSDDADSDGEFIGALAAAAAVGHDPDREWEQLGDPVADWERLDSDSADSAAEPARADAVEWTAEIVATDLRRRCSVRNESIVVASSRMTTALDYDPSWCGGLSPVPPASSVTTNHQLQQQQEQCSFNGHQPQQCHRRPPPPQFRPQPLEPPPPPPALSVAFTAVACPWWTVLEDVLLVTSATTNSGGSFSTSGPGFPLLTFD